MSGTHPSVLWPVRKKGFRVDQRDLAWQVAEFSYMIGQKTVRPQVPPLNLNVDSEGQMLRVLHVTECYEGGVAGVIGNIVALAPEVEHYLLYLHREGLSNRSDMFSRVAFLPNGPVGRVRAVRRAVREMKPDLVHAHSSWAGVYSRIIPLGVPVVYQPHNFAHVQSTKSVVARWFFRTAERLLGFRSRVIIGVSPQEVEHARALVGSRATLVSNLPTVPIRSAADEPTPGEHTGPVVMLGRICAEKDPSFFESVTSILVKQFPDVRMVWIGDGDPEMRGRLKDAGVRVTGWLDSDEVVRELDLASAYFHSASVEGFPLAVLDAAARGLPIVARPIPAFSGSGLLTSKNPKDAAVAIASLVFPTDAREKALEASSALLIRCSPELVREQLLEAYDRAHK